MAVAPTRPWLVLAGLALGLTVTNGFARFAYGLLLPAMKSELAWNYAQAGWLNTANALGYVAGAILTMILVRRISPSNLFVFGLVTTTFALLATGANAALWWQSLWRIMAGIFGAMSFATAGTLTAGLFQNDPRRNALAIAILFGSGGGLGIVLAGAALPLMLDVFGPGFWPYGWYVIGSLSLIILPLGVWSGLQLQTPVERAAIPARLPWARMIPMLVSYMFFGAGYIVFLTFLSAWMVEQDTSAGLVAVIWVVLGSCIAVSPVLWRPVFARFGTGLPMTLILVGIALGSSMPVLFHGPVALTASAIVFGLSVFMAPGAVTSFARQNLPADSWARAISLFTVAFAVAQTLGPYCAGLIGDHYGDIGISLLAASGLLLLGAGIALFQKRL